MVNIYTISDQNTGYVYYVGATKYALKVRFQNHLSSNYLPIFSDANIVPVIELIETVEPEISGDMELYWIAQFRNWGFNLFNSNKCAKYIYSYTPPKYKTPFTFTLDTYQHLVMLANLDKRSLANLVEVLVSQEFEKLPADVKKAAKSPAAIKELKEKLEKKKKG